MLSPGTGDDRIVLVLICGIFIIAAIAFWPLMTVMIWTTAPAAALMPFHRRFSRIVKPSASAAFLTLRVLLIILAVLSAAANVIYSDIQYIGTMAGSLIRGFEHTGLAAFLPPSLRRNSTICPTPSSRCSSGPSPHRDRTRFSSGSRSSSSSSSSPCSSITAKRSGTPSSGRFRTLFRPRSGDSQRLRIRPFIR